ncbi:hypothetical protein [Methylobacterium marchantiae]|uniref:Uncharacterized protein n=1 Tax=Methylobacterium marchantiae TaxID=600331 RepID=A0ABW3WY32_9HYPH|nr:hypothetical protein AIGOOFII_2937 [Methylobacterium marchantiae]
MRRGNFRTTLSDVTIVPFRIAVSTRDAAAIASDPARPQTGARPRSAASILLILLCLLTLVLPTVPPGPWADGMSGPVTSQRTDTVTGQAEAPSTSVVSRLDMDDALTLVPLPVSQTLGVVSPPTLRGRSALSLGISAEAPLHRPPRIAA